MPEVAPPSLIQAPAPAARPVATLPTFLNAWRGLWLFTWRPQLSWRRLPLAIFLLLILPVLVFITTPPQGPWSRHRSLMGEANMQFNDLARRLARAHAPLAPEQVSKLLPIFAEEFARAEEQARRLDPDDQLVDALAEQSKTCYQRIESRAKDILTERQLPAFQNFERRKLEEARLRWGEPRWSRSKTFYHWLLDFYFFVLVPLGCVRAAGSIIRDELQADTLGFLLTRPISRVRLMLAKYLAQTVWLQITILVQTLLLFAVGWLRHIPELLWLLPLFVGVQFLAVWAWSALGALLGLISARYLALAIIYGLIVELGIGQIPTNINTLSLIRHFKALLAHNPALESTYLWSYESLALGLAAPLFATGLFLTLGALLFTFREYHHTTEMQK